jgi:hypothetical protein
MLALLLITSLRHICIRRIAPSNASTSLRTNGCNDSLFALVAVMRL